MTPLVITLLSCILFSWVLNYREGMVGPLKGEADTRENRQMRIACYVVEGLAVLTALVLSLLVERFDRPLILGAAGGLVALLCYFLGWLFHRRPRERRAASSI